MIALPFPKPKIVTCLTLLVLLAGGCSAADHVERVEWTVMGTVAAVQWKGGFVRDEVAKQRIEIVKETFLAVERLLNAHEPKSELSVLAPRTDAEVLARCSPLVRPCYEAAFALRDKTGGVFNPRWRGPKTLDLGGIAKGFAVDLAAERLVPLVEGEDVLIDLGGNLKAVHGTWSTSVETPSDASRAAPMFTLSAPQSCATSGEYYRGHHIKDGRTGKDAHNSAYSVTVIHPDSAMLADGLSTVMFILGKERGERFLSEFAPGARVLWVGK